MKHLLISSCLALVMLTDYMQATKFNYENPTKQYPSMNERSSSHYKRASLDQNPTYNPRPPAPKPRPNAG